MDYTALNWAVLQLTDSPFHLGLINACRLVPAFLFSVPAGVMADRYDRRKLLILVQLGMMLLTFALAYQLEASRAFWPFALIVTARSVLSAMDPPIRNALISNLVSPDRLASAIAMNTAVINLSRIIGPLCAGMLLSAFPIHSIFWIYGWSTAAVLATLLLLRPEKGREQNRKRTDKGDIREAAEYIRNNPSVQSLLILAVVPMLFGFPYSSMMPLFAEELLQLGPEGFGLLLAVTAAGALAGSAWLSLGRGVRCAGKWLVCSIIVFGLSLLLFTFSAHIVPAAVFLFAAGTAGQIYRTMSRITLQTEVPDRLRGRMMSIALMDRGFIPLGALGIGALAAMAGARWAGIAMGLGCIVVTLLVVSLRRQIWRL